MWRNAVLAARNPARRMAQTPPTVEVPNEDVLRQLCAMAADYADSRKRGKDDAAAGWRQLFDMTAESRAPSVDRRALVNDMAAFAECKVPEQYLRELAPGAAPLSGALRPVSLDRAVLAWLIDSATAGYIPPTTGSPPIPPPPRPMLPPTGVSVPIPAPTAVSAPFGPPGACPPGTTRSPVPPHPCLPNVASEDRFIPGPKRTSESLPPQPPSVVTGGFGAPGQPPPLPPPRPAPTLGPCPPGTTRSPSPPYPCLPNVPTQDRYIPRQAPPAAPALMPPVPGPTWMKVPTDVTGQRPRFAPESSFDSVAPGGGGGLPFPFNAFGGGGGTSAGMLT